MDGRPQGPGRVSKRRPPDSGSAPGLRRFGRPGRKALRERIRREIASRLSDQQEASDGQVPQGRMGRMELGDRDRHREGQRHLHRKGHAHDRGQRDHPQCRPGQPRLYDRAGGWQPGNEVGIGAVQAGLSSGSPMPRRIGVGG
ncbi:hypothetical protein SI859A1_00430 [Aurantimonas manganoxydans SI85-9A1]|uniref:Uncharacterized protein n=1 Tax=Aurantimonas manganoxydans (strain ATCC BAA-1229 / DSM 21871 / SI85-9A1) TaxID=287752 RepID=Q1YH09_AURMS|nr:hypothetical protein SI859A1_00430 [Aurantimonas manganoxydans SI85-9A1]